MDLLFSRYASPLELMRLYIEQGRFGEFVTEIMELNNKRKQEEARKEDDDKLWMAYLLSGSDKSFIDWKNGLTQKNTQKKEPESLSMTNEQVESAKQSARGILSRFSPT